MFSSEFGRLPEEHDIMPFGFLLIALPERGCDTQVGDRRPVAGLVDLNVVAQVSDDNDLVHFASPCITEGARTCPHHGESVAPPLWV